MKGSQALGRGFAAALGVLALAAGPAAAAEPASVFTSTNDAAGNHVLAFARSADGSLSASGSFATGGLGNGADLSNQGALALGPLGRTLYVVNAGDNSVSSFAVRGTQLQQIDRVSSGGAKPVSLAVRGDRLFVLNGDGNSIAGYSGAASGHLVPIAGSVRALPGAGPAEIAFSADGKQVIVTERNSSTINTVPVAADGTAGVPVATSSSGAVPFGFDVDRAGDVVVSEAGGGPNGTSAVSSYSLAPDGALATISGSVGDTQAAACWVVTTANGRFAYIGNAGSSTVSSYAIGVGGAIGLLDPVAAVTPAGSHTTDLAQAGEKPELFALNAGRHALVGYAIGGNGSLAASGSIDGIPTTATGLVAQ